MLVVHGALRVADRDHWERDDDDREHDLEHDLDRCNRRRDALAARLGLPAPSRRQPLPERDGRPGRVEPAAEPVARPRWSVPPLARYARALRPGLAAWHGRTAACGGLPAIGVTASRAALVCGATVPANAVLVSPAPDALAVVDWRSPIAGDVVIAAGFADLDARCGGSVRYWVDRGPTSLAAGRGRSQRVEVAAAAPHAGRPRRVDRLRGRAECRHETGLRRDPAPGDDRAGVLSEVSRAASARRRTSRSVCSR